MVKQSPSGSQLERQNSAAAAELKLKGVRKRKWGKWVSEIRLPNSRERIWLGSYDSAEKAARAFDAALFCLRGRTAKFNFPNSPPDIPGGRSLSRDQIQAAALRFANSEVVAAEVLRTTPINADWSSSGSDLQPESPFAESSERLELDLDGSSELGLDESFLDQLANMGPDPGLGTFPSDYGIFPGFDDLCNVFFTHPDLPTTTSFEDQNQGGDFFLAQDSSSLWNF